MNYSFVDDNKYAFPIDNFHFSFDLKGVPQFPEIFQNPEN